MKTYNIGIIGYGGFGKFLHHWWSGLEEIRIAAIADANLENDSSDGLKHYKNWEDLVADNEIDIVSIATPPATHVLLACKAMREGKHVLLEKPIAINEEGAQEILRVQRETGMVLTVDHMLRYNPIIAALKHLSKEGIFGKLSHVGVTNYAQDEGLPPEHWFWDKKISGGIFIEHGVHFFDIVNSLTDETVKEVSGFAHKRNLSQEDKVAATVLYDGGLVASHYHSFSGPGFFEQTTIRLNYDLARIEVSGWMPMSGTINALVTAEGKQKLNAFPGLTIESEKPVEELTDVSRPEGWGNITSGTGKTIKAGGIDYTVSEKVSAVFEIQKSKSEVYGECLQKIIKDVIAKIEDGSHQLKITADDAYKALTIAVSADQSSKPKNPDPDISIH